LLIIVPPAIGIIWAVYEIIAMRMIKLDGHPGRDDIVSVEGTQDKAKILRTMVEISNHIAEGATSFLVEQYKWLSLYIVLFAILIGFVVSWPATVAFVLGSVTSGACGFIGMKTAVMSNVRTCHECWGSLTKGFETALRGGSVMGLALVSLGIECLYVTMLITLAWLGSASSAPSNDKEITKMEYIFASIAGYGLGGSSIALFARVAGGIYTKAADVGADLSGKNEYGMNEDDPRNPACIADNVGDNVGDIAGMGADLFGSFAEATCAAFLLLANACNPYDKSYASDVVYKDIMAGQLMFPLLISSVGVVAGLISILITRFAFPVKTLPQIERTLKILLLISTVIMTPVVIGLALGSYPEEFTIYDDEAQVHRYQVTWWKASVAVLMGLWGGLIIGVITEYYTSHSYRPVREIAETQRVSAATGIIFGLSLGYFSNAVPVIITAACALISHKFCGMYGVSLAALGMLSTLSVTLTVDAYGPISDNAGGIAEMAEVGEATREKTDALDAAGNTTAAIGKGFAIGSAALVSIALFGAFCVRAGIESLNLLDPWAFTGLLIGALMPYIFSGMTMRSVGIAAQDMVTECMRQFPGIISGAEKPDYTRCVSIATRASIKEMVAPGALVILTPVILGMALGKNCTAGILLGALSSGIQMAISMSNTGGAWDNAKKYIEANGLPGHGKGSAAHKNAVTGDTVGDPLKDTSGPALNILIKLSAIVSVMFASVLKSSTFSTSVGGPSWAK
jgi:inorganic pyrophosphatase